MTNQEIEMKFGELVKTERKITHRVLQYINLIEDRKIHLRAHSSMQSFLMQKHGYSSGSAGRRIAAARLLRAVPQAGEKIQTAAVNLTTLSQAQTFVRAEEKRTGQRLSKEAKADVIEKIADKTEDEVQKQLFEIFPEAQINKKDVIKAAGADKHRLSADISGKAKANVDRIKELMSHVDHEISISDLLETITEAYLEKNDPLRKVDQPRESGADSIPAATRRHVRQRDNDECQWEGDGKKCRSRFQIEIDHVIPRAHGGTHDPTNLRCLCRVHNQVYARQIFGNYPDRIIYEKRR